MDLFNSIISFQAMQPTKPRDTKPPKWFIEYEKRINARFDKQEEFNRQILDRLDNLENEVHTQFKAHGWM